MSVGCTPKCWSAVECPEHGERMPPWGRDNAGTACCENYARSIVNPRHLWDEHDSTRWYHDPIGWDAHQGYCAQCSGGDS